MTKVTDFIRGETQSKAGSRRELGHLSDEAVLALVSRGDEAALGELYDRYGRVAYGLALRIVRDRSLAEDAVQEAFLAVWRSAGSFRAEHGKPSTWILTLVHRRAVDLVRREERRRADPIDELSQPTGEATDEEAWLRAQRQVVQEALRKLPPDQREAIELALLRRLHAVGAGGTSRPAARHDQEPDVRRPPPAARAARGGRARGGRVLERRTSRHHVELNT